MVAVRKGLVFAGLLIAMIALAAPVTAAHSHPAPGSFNLTEVMAPAPAPSSPPHAMDASTRAMFDTMAVNDTNALAPAPTVFESVHPGESLQAAIDAAPADSVLYLDPGTYYEHDLIVNKPLRIMANQTLGGTRANTIIDARMEGRIFNATGASVFYIENLTLRNGYVDDDGGAIFAKNLLTAIISSTITNCSAAGDGGAVWSNGTMTVIGYSTVSYCTAVDGAGGAVYSDDRLFGAVYTTFTDCSAPDAWGGAIEAGGQVVVWYSTFTRCSAIDGGALDFYYDGASVLDSTFTDCTASNNGGALWADGGDVMVTGSTFTRCTAGYIGGAIAYGERIYLHTSAFTGCSAEMAGGAIATLGDITAIDVTFQGCSAGFDGGAVLAAPGIAASFINSTFTGCTASYTGGAISSWVGNLTVLSSSITGCSAAEGGAIGNYGNSADIHFCRIYGNTASGSGPAINTTSAVDATHTWWGTNSDPGPLMNGPVTYDPWLVLGITADPQAITLPQTSYIRTNLTYDSDGIDTSPGGIFVPNGIPNIYGVSGPGMVAPAAPGSVRGTAQGTYITTVAGAPTISGTVDGQTVYITLSVAQGDWTPEPTQVPNDDDWPQVSGGASGGSGGSSAAATGSTGYPMMTVTVNIGGDSKAGQATVTGTNLRDLIVTGTEQHGPFGTCNPTAGSVFQYIGLEPARYGTITNAVINFTVPQSWLDANSVAPGNVVLYHMTADCWQPLPTTFLYAKDGTTYFSAVSPGFSSFAIAGTPAMPAAVTAAATPVIVSTPEPQQTTAPAAVAKEPVTTQTTAPPASDQAPAKSSSFPLVPVLAVICCIGIISGGWYARRWWIRRQNPALFREY